MIARLRRRLGYGGTSWLTQPIVQAALGLLAVWILGTMANSLWRAATTDQPTRDQIDSYLAGLLIPRAVLPAGLLGSRPPPPAPAGGCHPCGLHRSPQRGGPPVPS